MSRKLKILVLGLIALSVAGVASGGVAQAAASHWTTETSDPLNGTKTIAESITLLKRESGESTPTGEVTIPGLGFTINFTGLKAVGGKVVGNGTISGSANGAFVSLKFTGATVTSAPGCTVKNSGGTVGTISTGAINLALVGESPSYALLTPTGSSFATIEIAKVEGKTCALSGNYSLGGTIAFKVDTNTMSETLHTESSQAIQEAAGKSLTFGGKAAFMDLNDQIRLALGIWGDHTSFP